MRGIKCKLADVERELSDESEQRKLVMPTGQFVYMWKIDKWQQKVDNAKEGCLLESNAFYVDPGCHMVIKACPCGKRASNNHHLVLFLCPTTGDFDARVDWPFSKAFTLSVVDQQLDAHAQGISVTASPPFKGLLVAGPTSKGLGVQRFTTHEKLKLVVTSKLMLYLSNCLGNYEDQFD